MRLFSISPACPFPTHSYFSALILDPKPSVDSVSFSIPTSKRIIDHRVLATGWSGLAQGHHGTWKKPTTPKVATDTNYRVTGQNVAQETERN